MILASEHIDEQGLAAVPERTGMADYLALPHVSASDARALDLSPAHYIVQKETVGDETDATLEGSAFHCAVLEPHDFEAQYRFHQGSRSAKMKAEAAEQGIRLLRWAARVSILGWVRAVSENPDASRLMAADGPVETTLTWLDPETGVPCRCRPDKMVPEWAAFVDLKKMTRSGKTAPLRYLWARAFSTYQHYVSAAHTLRCARANGMPYDTYLFVVVTAEPPYEVGVFAASNRAMEFGNALIDRALGVAKDCALKGEWPGPQYPGIEVTDLTGWEEKRQEARMAGDSSPSELTEIWE